MYLLKYVLLTLGGELDKMDPYKGSFLQNVLTFILKPFLYISYYIAKAYFKIRKIEEKVKEDPHYIDFTQSPIPSFKLAQALNPKTEPQKLTLFAEDEDPYVRRAVTRNPSLPKESLQKLSKDKILIVAREAKEVLENPDYIVNESYPTQHGG